MTLKKLKDEVGKERVGLKLDNMSTATNLLEKMSMWFDFINKLIIEGLSEDEAGLIIEQAEKITVILEPDQKTFAEDFANKFSDIKRPLLLADEDNASQRIYEVEQRLERIINPENYSDLHVEKCSLINLRAIIKQNQVEIAQMTKKRLSPVIS